MDRLRYLRALSRQTLSVIAQNHWFTVTTDLIRASLAVSEAFSPLLSGLAHVGHTLATGANASRLLNWQPRDDEIFGDRRCPTGSS